VIELDRVTFHEILHEVTLSVDSQETLAIVGPSGSGKTTLLRAVLGSSSQLGYRSYRQASRERGWQAAAPPEERHLAMVFQDLALCRT